MADLAHLGAPGLGRRISVPEATEDSVQQYQRGLVPVLSPSWTLQTPYKSRAARCLTDEKTSALAKLAFVFLWLLAFAIPCESVLMIPSVGTVARLIGMGAFALGILAIGERQRIRQPCLGQFIMTLFVLWASISYLWSADPEGTLLVLSSYLQLLVMVWLIWELSSREQEQMRLMQAYVLGTYVSGIDTLYQYRSDPHMDYQRYAGAGFNPNELALIMALSIPVSYYLLIQNKGRMVWVYRLQLVLAGVTIMLTASRGGGLASLVALSIVPLTYARSTSVHHRILNLLAAAVLVCGGLFLVPPASWERLSTIPNEFTQGTLNKRTVVWSAGLEVFREHPYLGVGAGAFQEAVRHTFTEPLTAHNTFLSVLVEEGVIGFALLCALLAVLAICAKEMPTLPQKLWIVFLAAWGVGVCSCSFELRKPTWFFFSLLLSQGASMVQKGSPDGHGRGLARHSRILCANSLL